MSKSNHQKHGFHPLSKEFKRSKDFVSVKGYLGRLKKECKFNGQPYKGIFGGGEVGKVEMIRFIE